MEIRKSVNLITIMTPGFRRVLADRADQQEAALDQHFAEYEATLRQEMIRHAGHPAMSEQLTAARNQGQKQVEAGKASIARDRALLDSETVPDGTRVQIGQFEMTQEVRIGMRQEEVLEPGEIVFRDGVVIDCRNGTLPTMVGMEGSPLVMPNGAHQELPA